MTLIRSIMKAFRLPAGGWDSFYIDESAGSDIFVMACVRVPLLRPDAGEWLISWPYYYEAATQWRRKMAADSQVKFRQEIHSSEFLAGKGKLHKLNRPLSKIEAAEAFRAALRRLDYLDDASILVTSATKDSGLYGNTRMQAALTALLQRLRTQTTKEQRAGLVFFDEGHREYFTLYRKSQVYLPTGSMFGGWDDGRSRNLPLSAFIEDGNAKSSKDSYFLQIADMIAYSALQKLKAEKQKLATWRLELEHHTLYDAIPRNVINLRATNKRSDGIVPL